MDKAEDNQHFQFTVKIWTNGMNLLLSTKEDNVQIARNGKIPFLDMNMSWYPEGDL